MNSPILYQSEYGKSTSTKDVGLSRRTTSESSHMETDLAEGKRIAPDVGDLGGAASDPQRPRIHLVTIDDLLPPAKFFYACGIEVHGFDDQPEGRPEHPNAETL
jgi:hypothetical protein